MELHQEWQTLVQETVNLVGKDLIGNKEVGVRTLPFYGAQGESPTFISSSFKSGMRHIVPADRRLWSDEFLSAPGSAVEISDPEMWTHFDQISSAFVKGAYWVNGETLVPWLKSLSEGQTINLGWDPWAIGLHHGRMYRPSDEEFPVQIFKDGEFPNVRAFYLSSELYSAAGGVASQELAVLLASVVESCRFFQDRLSGGGLLRQFSLEVVAETDPLFTAAKVQSLKLLWRRLSELLGEEESLDVPIYVTPSVRNFTTREPWNNLVRMTLMQSGATFGGASGFRHCPFDIFSKTPLEGGRLSRNIGLVLQSESGLGYVQNPTEGAGVVNHWVAQLCEQAWQVFQEIDQKGGLIATLQAGWLQAELRKSGDQEQDDVDKKTKTIVGVTEFVGLENLSQHYPFIEKKKSQTILEWWEKKMKGLELKKEFMVKPVVPKQLSRIYEDYQMDADSEAQSLGCRPHVFVYCEDVKKQASKISKLKALLGVAGVDCIVKSTLEDTGAKLACCLGVDPGAEHWPQSIERLREMNYKKIIWFGERENQIFDGHWGMTPKLSALCKDIHEGLGVSK